MELMLEFQKVVIPDLGTGIQTPELADPGMKERNVLRLNEQ
jgi:hypothetical protein